MGGVATTNGKEPGWVFHAAGMVEIAACEAGLWSTRDMLSAIMSRAVNALDELQHEPPGDDAIGRRIEAAGTIRDDCARLLASYAEYER